jgi:serine/threonine-protein kinase
MEYIDGVNLREVIRRAGSVGLALPIAFCARVVSAACEGLAFAHDFIDPATNLPMNIVHRDISPDNILLSRQGSVKLLDFGIAKAAGVSPHTQTGILKGKLAYMPPEQLRNEPLDRRADIYSLGIVLYELLTGFKPFRATSEAGLLQAILVEPEVPVEQRRTDVPETLQRILARAISKERERRYPDCASFQAELEALIVELIVSTGKPMGAAQMAGIVSMMTPIPESGSFSPLKTTSLPRTYPRLTPSLPQLEPSSSERKPPAEPSPPQDVSQPQVRELKDDRTTVARPSRLSPKVPKLHDTETPWAVVASVLLVLAGGGYLSQRVLVEGQAEDTVSAAAVDPAPQEAASTRRADQSHPAATQSLSGGTPPSTLLASLLPGSGAEPLDGGASLPRVSQDVLVASRDAGVTALAKEASTKTTSKTAEKDQSQHAVVGQGTLELMVVPEAMLYLNGWQMGLTRKTSFPLDAGKYTLKLVNSQLQKKVEREILVSVGQTTQIDINLLEE